MGFTKQAELERFDEAVAEMTARLLPEVKGVTECVDCLKQFECRGEMIFGEFCPKDSRCGCTDQPAMVSPCGTCGGLFEGEGNYCSIHQQADQTRAA